MAVKKQVWRREGRRKEFIGYTGFEQLCTSIIIL
jgi:hypothetical protein